MRKNQRNSQRDASAPGNPTIQHDSLLEDSQRRIAGLVAQHVPIARLICSGQDSVFYILDLDDPIGMSIAKTLSPDAPVERIRDMISDKGLIPSFTFAAGVDTLRPLLATVLQLEDDACPPPPPGSYYIAVFAANTIALTVQQLPRPGESGLN